MKINQYLNKIEQGQPINLDAFINLLKKKNGGEWQKIYQSQRVQKGYILTILDIDKHNTLFTNEITNRVDAAKQGRSHHFPSQYSNILVLNHSRIDQIPFVVVSQEKGWKSTIQDFNSNAIIMENIEVFYRYKEYLTNIGHQSLIETSDILFGAGNQITNQLNISFLSQYQKIYCAQDIEYGGFKIFQTLKNRLPQCQWLAPRNWVEFIDKFTLVPKNENQLINAIEIARSLHLHAEADLMNQTRHFLEQESLLVHIKERSF